MHTARAAGKEEETRAKQKRKSEGIKQSTKFD
jgi:hypothetical protein